MGDETYTILCVDDEPEVLAALRRELRRGPYEVLEATSGMEAMEILKSRQVAVAISDETMPGMGGVALLQWVTAWPSGLPTPARESLRRICRGFLNRFSRPRRREPEPAWDSRSRIES